MIKTHTNTAGRTVKTLNRKTNQIIVTETRQPKPFRALPRQVSDQIAALEVSKKFLVRYQDLINLSVTATRCWKCGVVICAYQPALRKVEGASGSNNAELVKATINGQETVLSAMLPYQHYREGLFAYHIPRRQIIPVPTFSYLHCADCQIKDEDGESLLACLLGCPDWKRDLLKASVLPQSDDEWAQRMYYWSGIELVGRAGPSVSPADLMKRKG